MLESQSWVVPLNKEVTNDLLGPKLLHLVRDTYYLAQSNIVDPYSVSVSSIGNLSFQLWLK
jgi:hypothetical protein